MRGSSRQPLQGRALSATSAGSAYFCPLSFPPSLWLLIPAHKSMDDIMMLSTRLSGGIVGAGIVGLASAIALRRAGHDVEVSQQNHQRNRLHYH